jgi:hypothetical protein
MKRTVTVIPAAPGHHAVSHDCSDGELHVRTSPIIAWEIRLTDYGNGDHGGLVLPISTHFAFDAILHPDGKVDRNDNCPSYDGMWERGDFFDSMEDYKWAAYKHYFG